MVKLSNGHVIIDQATALALFGDTSQVLWVYYPQRHTLMVATPADELFKSVHKTATSLLKLRNDHGDRSLSVLELILDHDLDDTNRQLEYTADEQMKVLSVYFGTGANFSQS